MTTIIEDTAMFWLLATCCLLLITTAAGIFCRRRVAARTNALEQEVINHRRTEQALRQSEEQLRTVIATTTEGYWQVDPLTLRTIDVNQALCTMLGYEHGEMIGKTPLYFAAEKQQRLFMHGVVSGNEATHHIYDIALQAKSGTIVQTRCSATMLADTTGAPTMAFAFISDVSAQKQYEEQLRYQAQYDLLTGQPNRLLLYERIEHAIAHGQRHGSFLVLLLLDLDNFKVVNDTLGHMVGDLLLKDFAERINRELRQGDTFARLGGDEFVILPDGITCNQDIIIFTRRIFSALEAPFELDGHELYVTASIGISRYPDDGDTADILLKHADAAMYLAKNAGRNDFRFFTRDLDIKMHERLDLETRLRKALDRNEYELHYQPQINMATGCVIGLEALLRWRRDGAPVSPAEFIPVLEDTGMIVAVGAWVLRTACRYAAGWQQDADYPPTISVNLSARQLQQPDLVRQVLAVLDETGLPPARLMLELTESMLMGNERDTLAKLFELKQHGIRLSIDDFGTGYSSLAYLAHLPIHELKIDRSFVSALPYDQNNAEIVSAIIALARVLKLQVVAEGVETPEQAAFLMRSGLSNAQGYYFSRPLPPLELQNVAFPAWLVTGNPLHAPHTLHYA